MTPRRYELTNEQWERMEKTQRRTCGIWVLGELGYLMMIQLVM